VFVLPPYHRLRGIHFLALWPPPCQAMISPGNSHSSQGFLLCSASAQILFSATQRYISLLWPWRDLSDALPASILRPSLPYALESSVHLPYELALSPVVSSLLSPRVSILPSFFWKVPNPSRSFYQKEAGVYRSLWYFGLTFCS
jgi:hypothetical protein